MNDKSVHVLESVSSPSMYLGASRSMPDFSGKVSGDSVKDQKSMDDWAHSTFELESGKY